MLVNHVNDPVQQHLNQRGLFAKRVVSPLSQNAVAVQVQRCVDRDLDSFIALHVSISLCVEFLSTMISIGRIMETMSAQISKVYVIITFRVAFSSNL